MSNFSLTDEEKRKKYGCYYCVAIGACPRCHGRAGYDRLIKELAEAKKNLASMNTRDRYDAVAWERDEKIRTELLAALRWIADEADGVNAQDPDEIENSLRSIRDKTRAAIAKATGGSK